MAWHADRNSTCGEFCIDHITYKEEVKMLDDERKQLDDAVNKMARQVTTTTAIYILLVVIVLAVVWKVL